MDLVATYLALLALSAGSPILVSCLRRVADVCFMQSYAPVTMPDSGDRKTAIFTVTAEAQAVFERFIRQWPDQWMWAHKRCSRVDIRRGLLGTGLHHADRHLERELGSPEAAASSRLPEQGGA
ncbi:MAG: hypothetical protein ACRYGP_16630 [Janthinobacterium lividum]